MVSKAPNGLKGARATAPSSGRSSAFSFVSHIFSGIWHELTRNAVRVYRSERRYMRRPLPAWRAKHGSFPAA